MRLRWKAEATQRFLKFAVIGFSGYLLNAGLLELFARSSFLAALLQHHPGLGHLPGGAFLTRPSGWAAALATEGSIIHNFIWNHVWTFHGRSAGRLGESTRKFLSFNLCSFGSVLIQFLRHGAGDPHAGRHDGDPADHAHPDHRVPSVVPLNWLIYNCVIWKHQAC